MDIKGVLNSTIEVQPVKRYTHRNPVTGQFWDDFKGQWVNEIAETEEPKNGKKEG